MYKVRVMITNKQKDIKVPTGLRLLIRRCCNAVLAYEAFADSAEISVSLVGNDYIRHLNQEYRGKDVPTDVLSFPLSHGGKHERNPETNAVILGDIVISMTMAMEQAARYGHSLQREIGFLTVHSMLHLLGYDHEKPGIDSVRMREKEEAILTQLGLTRNGSYAFTDEDQ